MSPAAGYAYRRRMSVTAPRDRTDGSLRPARIGVWLLPLYGLLLTLSTLTHQPDPQTDLAGYSRYVTTDVFLVSHLVGSILGGALGLVANTLVTAVFAAAAFAQPAIGRAFLAGGAGMPALNDDVYGAPLFATAAVGLLLFIAGAVVFGRAVARSSAALRWPGYGYAAGLSLFVVAAFALPVLQPVAGVVTTAAAVLVAMRLPGVPTEDGAG
jgi:hypothetical protein